MRNSWSRHKNAKHIDSCSKNFKLCRCLFYETSIFPNHLFIFVKNDLRFTHLFSGLSTHHTSINQSMNQPINRSPSSSELHRREEAMKLQHMHAIGSITGLHKTMKSLSCRPELNCGSSTMLLEYLQLQRSDADAFQFVASYLAHLESLTPANSIRQTKAESPGAKDVSLNSLNNHASTELKPRSPTSGLKVVHANLADMALPGPAKVTRTAPRTFVIFRAPKPQSSMFRFHVSEWHCRVQRFGPLHSEKDLMPIGTTASCLPVCANQLRIFRIRQGSS